jgi:hypothetical protein
MNASKPSGPYKVILVEVNEITWRLIDPLLARKKLPTFAEYLAEGTAASPVATEVPPQQDLDPWIAWTTVYTGRPQEEHGVRFLEQPPETVTGPRIWEIAADAGKSLGVYGSIMSWPPRQGVRGFWVPSTFSPGTETYPASLRPIQELNLGHTRAHTPLAKDAPSKGKLGRLLELRKLGLKLSTACKLASFLVRTKIWKHRKWEKVSLQPLVNLDFFEKLYREHRPDLATFHTNHVAHYQHRYWRTFDATPFLRKPSAEEQRQFGGCIEFGYQVADTLLKRTWKLAGPDTVVLVASGLGQQPYVDERFEDGRPIVRVRDVHQIIELCGVTGHCTPVSMMAPQWNLQIPDPAKRAQAERTLASAYVGTPEIRLFTYEMVGDTINFNVQQKALTKLDLSAPCVFPEAGKTVPMGELCAIEDPTAKEGYHDRVGMAIFRGPGIRKGARIGECSNLDLAPTILHLLGLPIPSYMKGRVLEEIFDGSGARLQPVHS